MKVEKRPWPALFPCPVVLVTCIGQEERPNIITIAWVGTLCSTPPIVGIGIRPTRHSYNLIKETGEFVVNIPTTNLLREVDLCGTISGRDVDKFEETGLTSLPAVKVKPPIIKECPVNIECTLKDEMPLGTHNLFLGEVVLVHVDEDILDERGRVDFTKISPIVYNQGEYWSLKEKVGLHGFVKQR